MPRELVRVGRTNAASGSTDGLVAARLFTRLIQGNVVGQNQRASLADNNAFAGRNTVRLKMAQFLQQRFRGQHHAVADQAFYIFPQHSRRNQVQNGFYTVDDQRVAGVVSTLEAHHGAGLVGQQVDNLALAFIPPLGTDYNHCFCH